MLVFEVQKIIIFVKTLSRKSLCLRVAEWEAVDTLIDKIYTLVGIREEIMKLL